MLDELAGRRLHAQLVGVQGATGQQHSIELVRMRIRERHIRLKALVPLIVFHALDLGLRRDEHGDDRVQPDPPSWLHR